MNHEDKPTYYNLSKNQIKEKFDDQSTQSVFTKIYKENFWEQEESVSGPGSSLLQTREIIRLLPDLFAKFDIQSVLDLPCGDFNWMRHLDWSTIQYTGADIVEALVEKNQKMFGSANLNFKALNLLSDDLPQVDLVFCRDCLVHLSFEDIQLAFKNIHKNGSKYLLTTTFPPRENIDITTGDWRVLNLEKAPFNLPPPLFLLNEKCTEMDGQYADKSLGLWKIAQIS